MHLELKMEELANERLEAIKQANLEAEAAGATSLREEADRLVTEHRERMAELQEGMEVRKNACGAAKYLALTPAHKLELGSDVWISMT